MSRKCGLLLLVLAVCALGCNDYPAPKFRLTLHYPDGTTKVIETTNVSRDNNSGAWFWYPPDKIQAESFRGRVEIEPIVDITPSPEPVKAELEPNANTKLASGSVESMGEENK